MNIKHEVNTFCASVSDDWRPLVVGAVVAAVQVSCMMTVMIAIPFIAGWVSL